MRGPIPSRYGKFFIFAISARLRGADPSIRLCSGSSASIWLGGIEIGLGKWIRLSVVPSFGIRLRVVPFFGIDFASFRRLRIDLRRPCASLVVVVVAQLALLSSSTTSPSSPLSSTPLSSSLLSSLLLLSPCSSGCARSSFSLDWLQE
jgi:hypothetical protein